jgi:hypothetical protein
MLNRTVALFTFAFLISSAVNAQAVHAATVHIGLVSPAGTLAPSAGSVAALSAHDLDVQTDPDFARILLGTTLGAVAGAAAGLAVSYVVIQATGGPSDGEMFFPLRVALWAVPAVPVGMFLGARWGSDGRGDPWLTAGAAVLGTGAGILAGVLVGDALARGSGGGAGPEIIGSIVGIGVGVTIPALVEWATAR